MPTLHGAPSMLKEFCLNKDYKEGICVHLHPAAFYMALKIPQILWIGDATQAEYCFCTKAWLEAMLHISKSQRTLYPNYLFSLQGSKGLLE